MVSPALREGLPRAGSGEPSGLLLRIDPKLALLKKEGTKPLFKGLGNLTKLNTINSNCIGDSEVPVVSPQRLTALSHLLAVGCELSI
ncbi:hypothetical protein DP113_29790 [Brasilonema octagenarum UFV-E1]|uniref:Uncharacterized protein n=2 Tax=Brasilonema TaxID=383614 RepID=A0A856MR16_9CYAN|nr:hypothetical protein [Brasilonema octagenarum UFV-OR1]QDL11506.1 hypothetical protein DP114_29630 [Brasilonema sennae CENA114]QDL17888.1 hypothetical protein DP113_29790 [Brasilonema octagenarum UFV-E1]